MGKYIYTKTLMASRIRREELQQEITNGIKTPAEKNNSKKY